MFITCGKTWKTKSLWESRAADQEALIMGCLFHKIVAKNYGERGSIAPENCGGFLHQKTWIFQGRTLEQCIVFLGCSSTAWIPLESPLQAFSWDGSVGMVPVDPSVEIWGWIPQEWGLWELSQLPWLLPRLGTASGASPGASRALSSQDLLGLP